MTEDQKAWKGTYYIRSLVCVMCENAPEDAHMVQVRHKRHHNIVVCENCCNQLILHDQLLPWED